MAVVSPTFASCLFVSVGLLLPLLFLTGPGEARHVHINVFCIRKDECLLTNTFYSVLRSSLSLISKADWQPIRVHNSPEKLWQETGTCYTLSTPKGVFIVTGLDLLHILPVTFFSVARKKFCLEIYQDRRNKMDLMKELFKIPASPVCLQGYPGDKVMDIYIRRRPGRLSVAIMGWGDRCV